MDKETHGQIRNIQRDIRTRGTKRGWLTYACNPFLYKSERNNSLLSLPS